MRSADALVMAAGNALLPFGITLELASHLAASQLPRRVSIPAVAASAAALAVAQTIPAHDDTGSPVVHDYQR